MSGTTLALMNTDELLALPEDGTERELIRGELREKEMTRRNPFHSEATAAVSRILGNWMCRQPKPRGRVLAGEAGFRLRRDPDTTVGIDVALISAELAAATAAGARLVDGVPILAVEILSPSDKQEEITDKVAEYLSSGVPLVWIIDPVFRTVLVYRPDARPQLFTVDGEITAEPHLPGFRAPVSEMFDD